MKAKVSVSKIQSTKVIKGENVNKKNCRGSLTIEAVISYTIFAMVMLTLLFIIKIVYTYGVVQHAINQTAKELASYSYIYSITVGKIDVSISDSTESGRKYFDKTADQLVTTYNSLTDLLESASPAADAFYEGDVENLGKSLNNINVKGQEVKESLPEAKEAVKKIVSDPKKAFKSFVGVMTYGASENIKTLVCGEIVRTMMAEYIDPNTGTMEAANQKLEKLHVIGGMDGLDFSGSSFFSQGSMNIDIVVCYSLKPMVPINLLPNLNFVNRIYIRGWGGSSVTPGNNKNSIWNDKGDGNRGFALQEKANLRNLPEYFPVFSKFEDGKAIACISIDLREKTYQDQSKLTGRIMAKCSDIINFKKAKRGEITLSKDDIEQKELVILIPPSTEEIGEVDKLLLNNSIEKARDRYPDIIIKVIEIDADSLE
jgi:hypothetical protein